ncbi:DMT family transporter [Sphingomonas sp.]|uniref:DMT family transporter n=1 Tax=Sphingomonas sp. TaxID=28214 RepID=UPI0035AF8039
MVPQEGTRVARVERRGGGRYGEGMSLGLPFILILLAGIGIAVQAPTNAALARISGSVLLAALVSFLVGTVVLLVAWMALDRTMPPALKGAPSWAWLGGFYGAGFVAAIAFAAPRLGLATALTVAIASQLATALALDHFGMLGLRTDPVTVPKLLGTALVIAGAVLVRHG